ncbi:MAG: NAD(P)-dependent oxidoreductase [Anaerolineae bacterium]|nr:NAD(P)-dependent oxidoreductase [Anaerolineae bacterium]
MVKNSEPIIMITGGAGYIGSQLVRDLAVDPHFANCIIRIYDNLQRQHFCGLMDLPTSGRYEFIEGDILDRLNLERAMHDAKIIIHLAALVHTPLSFDHPEWTNQVNHWGTASVVECALDVGVPRFIYVSSASVYGPGGPFREEDPCNPFGSYAISKLKGEKEVIQGDERGLHTTIVRLGTTYGMAPAMRFEATVNQFAYLTGVKRPMVIHGSGEQVRPSIHIRDASAVLRFCLSNFSTESEIINAATANPTVNDIANMMQDLSPDAIVYYTDQDTLTEVSYEIDSTKLFEMGFQPQYTLEEGIRDIVSHWPGYQPVFRVHDHDPFD